MGTETRSIRSVYQCELTTLTPVHIGSGDKYLRNFDFLYQNNKVSIFDRRKLFSLIEQGGVKLITSYTLAIENDTLEQWFTENHIKIQDILVHTFIAKKPPKDISIQQRDGQGNPYIPGSSLKGAIRTAVLAKLSLEDERKTVDAYLQNLKKRRKIDPKIADQDITQKFLGRDAKQSFMRSLTVGDFRFPLSSVGVQQVWLGRLTGEEEFKNKFPVSPISIEQLKREEKVLGQVSFDDFLGMEATEGKGSSYFNFPHMLSLSWLLEAMREKTVKTIASELEFLKDKSGNTIKGLQNFYHQLRTSCEQLATDEAVVQLGWGSGWRGMTGQLLEPEDLTTELRKQLKLAPNYMEFPFPKSRRSTEIHNQTMPMGWVKLKFIPKAEIIRRQKQERAEQEALEIARQEGWRKFLEAIQSAEVNWGYFDTHILNYQSRKEWQQFENVADWQARKDVAQSAKNLACQIRESNLQKWDTQRDEQLQSWLAVSGVNWELSSNNDTTSSSESEQQLIQQMQVYSDWNQFKIKPPDLVGMPLKALQALQAVFFKQGWHKKPPKKKAKQAQVEKYEAWQKIQQRVRDLGNN
nr:type III-A CRISPR-associated RAMP protein Csm5 [uncultured Desulfobulbus sp.]